MAIVKLDFFCGCRFHTRTIEEAIAHVDVTGHTLSNVNGTIILNERKVLKVKPFSYDHKEARFQEKVTKKHSSRPSPQQEAPGDRVDFSNLRERLSRKRQQ